MAKISDSVYVEFDGEQYLVLEVVNEETEERQIRIFNAAGQEFAWDHPRYDRVLKKVPAGFGSTGPLPVLEVEDTPWDDGANSSE